MTSFSRKAARDAERRNFTRGLPKPRLSGKKYRSTTVRKDQVSEMEFFALIREERRNILMRRFSDYLSAKLEQSLNYSDYLSGDFFERLQSFPVDYRDYE